MADNTFLIQTCLCLYLLSGVVYSSNCTYGIPVYGSGNVEYITSVKTCSNGCCGYYYNRECCKNHTPFIIAGAAIGGLLFIALIIGIIACCCHKGKKTAAVEPHRHSTVHDIHMTATPIQPPPYQEQSAYHPPPSYLEMEEPGTSYPTKGQGFPPVG